MRNKLHTFESFISNDNEHNIKVILDNYLEAALWTDEEELIENYNKENPNDTLENGHFTIYDFTEETKIKSTEDIKKFMELVGSAADGIDDGMIGHDFWLTRNGHGANFLDREYPEDIKNTLYRVASEFKGVNLSIDEDKKLIIE